MTNDKSNLISHPVNLRALTLPLGNGFNFQMSKASLKWLCVDQAFYQARFIH